MQKSGNGRGECGRAQGCAALDSAVSIIDAVREFSI